MQKIYNKKWKIKKIYLLLKDFAKSQKAKLQQIEVTMQT
jgi:hypothetical protein